MSIDALIPWRQYYSLFGGTVTDKSLIVKELLPLFSLDGILPRSIAILLVKANCFLEIT
jgi:hypothetical protein